MAINESIPDHELVKRLQKDDLAAFDHIFNNYSNRLFGFAFKYLKSKEDAEGLVQDVFLKIWKNRKKIKKESSLKSYLFTIAYHNMCRIFRRRQSYLKYLEESGIEEKSANDLEKQIEYKAILDKINNIIEGLSDRQKNIFIKSRREGKSTKQIASEMNLAPGTVDNNISATLKLLRKYISEESFTLILFFSTLVQ